MMTELFNQFEIPELLGIKSIPIVMAVQMLIIWTPNQVHTNRLTSTTSWLVKKISKHLLVTTNKPAHTWAMILVITIMLISTMNTSGLLPYTFTPTTQLSTNMALAVPLWMATVILGYRNQPAHSLSHMLPEGTPNLLIPVLTVIETISLLIRPLALGVRLTANLTAGHLLMQLISMAIIKAHPLLLPAMFGTLILLAVLELAVAIIQAYVFTLLLTLYLQENTNE